jgi:uncharacterized protein YndB with AHSA1/START domain
MAKSIDRIYQINHPPDIVFATWVSESAVFPPVEKIDIDPIPGGIYQLTMRGGSAMSGRFLQFEPNKQLRYSWQWTGDEEITTVTVRFSAQKGGTRIVLRHEGFLTADSMRNHSEGWDAYVDNLGKHLDTL